MTLTINGEPKPCTAETLAALVESLGMKPDRVAIELNREIVPRDQWPQTALHEGDRLEIVHFVGGGSGATANCHPDRSEGPLHPRPAAATGNLLESHFPTC
jgi:thiamine biosynthesis protein ThiS